MAEKFKTIVIGTSLAEICDGVVRTGVQVAKATGATPWLVHSYSLAAFAAEISDARLLEWQEESVSAGLAEQAKRTGLDSLPGFKPDQLVQRIGSPPREIADLAREVKADLIVVGAQESGALRRIFLGSTADGVIRKAPCPVLVVRSEAAFPPTRVEIPVDLSPVSADAMRQGLGFLAGIGATTAETEVLFVLNPFEVGGSIQFTPAQIERFAGEELRCFMKANSSGGELHRARIRTGYPREEILNVLKERQADLAILGTHGRTGFERLTLGSVAVEVMHQAACNLLLIPPRAGVEREQPSWTQPLDQSADWVYVSDQDPALVGK